MIRAFPNHLDPAVYKVLVVDPPWNQRKTGRRSVRPNQTTTLDYPTLTKADLMESPIPAWSDPNRSYLWLWATNSKDQRTKEPILVTAFQLMAHWDFNYYTTITWNKGTGPCPFGPYQITTEHILFRYRGTGKFHRSVLGKLQTHFTASPGAHSTKPDTFYQDIVRYFDGPRLDVFARQPRTDFQGWGDEYGTLATDSKRRNLS